MSETGHGGGQAGGRATRRSSASAAALAEKAQGEGRARPYGQHNAPLAAQGKDVFAAIAIAGDPEAEVAGAHEPADDGAPDAGQPEELGGAGTGYFWVTLAEAFEGAETAAAGPFDTMDAGFAAGRALARRAGLRFYRMAEFDAAGRQLTPTATWSAETLDAPQADGGAAPGADEPASDPVQALYDRPALAEDGEAAPRSHWARRKRQRARRRSGGGSRKR